MAKFKVGDIVKPKAEKALWTFGAHLSKILELEVLRTRGDFMDVRLKKATGEGKKYEQHIFEFVRQDDYNLVSRKRELHVTSDGTTTHAVLKEGGKVVKRAKAVCSPEDEYSFETGARLAIDRVFGKEEKKERQPLFKKGDEVKVVDPEYAITTNTHPEDFSLSYGEIVRYAYGQAPLIGVNYKVLTVSKQICSGSYIYTIAEWGSSPVYIITEEGLRKCS